jgi:hypothetical protein
MATEPLSTCTTQQMPSLSMFWLCLAVLLALAQSSLPSSVVWAEDERLEIQHVQDEYDIMRHKLLSHNISLPTDEFGHTIEGLEVVFAKIRFPVFRYGKEFALQFDLDPPPVAGVEVPVEWRSPASAAPSLRVKKLHLSNQERLTRLRRLLVTEWGQERLCLGPFPERADAHTPQLRWLHTPKTSSTFANSFFQVSS